MKFYQEFLKYSEKIKQKALTRFNRRSFLKASGMAVIGFSLPYPSYQSKCIRPKNPPSGDAMVGITRKDTIEDMVFTAIDLAGGLDEINQGDTVFIKPNITIKDNPDYHGIRVVTNPEILRAVIRAVKERTDEKAITVADACAFGRSTREAAQSTGIYTVCLEEGVNFLALEEENYISFRHKDFSHIRFARKIPASLSSFDHFINLPILKNHEMVPYSNVSYTCCLKNFVGLISPDNRLDLHTWNLGQKIAELNLCVPTITMNIVDALTVILTDGPAGSNMKTAHAGLVIASKDRVACDSLALAVLKHYASERNIRRDYVNQSVWKQAQIKHAAFLGLGRTNPEQIIILEEGVDNIDSILAEWC